MDLPTSVKVKLTDAPSSVTTLGVYFSPSTVTLRSRGRLACVAYFYTHEKYQGEKQQQQQQQTNNNRNKHDKVAIAEWSVSSSSYDCKTELIYEATDVD